MERNKVRFGKVDMVASVAILITLLAWPIIFIGITVGETNIPAHQVISHSTTWGISASPYIIEGDVTVEQGATLTIEPGVELIFNYTNPNIYCYGRIEAIGTPSNRISVHGTNTFNYQGTGFYMMATGHINASYCDFWKLKKGVAIYSDNYGNVTDCNFSEIEHEAIIIEHSNHLTIRDNQFTDNSIVLWPFAGYDFTNCIIEGNTVNDRPIYYFQNQANVTVPADAGSVLISNCTDITIDSLEVSGLIGIEVLHSDRVVISNTNMSGARAAGLWAGRTKDLMVDGCEIVNNNYRTGIYNEGGMNFWFTENTTINDCLFINNTIGLNFNQDKYLTLSSNEFYKEGICVQSLLTEDFPYIAIENNLVNGKPLYVYEDASDIKVPQNAGAIIMVNCTDSLIEGFNISNAGCGIQLLSCNNLRIEGCEFCDDFTPVFSRSVTNSDFSNCTFIKNECALLFRGSNENRIFNNEMTGGIYWFTETMGKSRDGISLDGSHNNMIYNNNISDMGYALGIWAYDNVIYHNNIFNYGQNAAFTDGTGNAFVLDYPQGGNYWDKYVGVDEKWGTFQSKPGTDGIGDTKFPIDSQYPDMIDSFPLMHPYAWWGDVPPVVELISHNTSQLTPGDEIVFNIWDGNLDLETEIYSLNGEDYVDMEKIPIINTNGWIDGVYKIVVLANDTSGHSTRSTHTLVINSVKPTVIDTMPVNGAINVSLGANVTIFFSEPMSDSNQVVIFTPSVQTPSFYWNNDSDVLRIDPRDNLLAGTKYVVRIGHPMTDLYGLNMDDDYVFSFTTSETGTGNATDSDGDDIPDTVDTDDDNDGTPDADDIFPLDPNEWLDTDEDGTGNNADTDDDNDGVPDAEDFDPLDPEVTEDPAARTLLSQYWWVFLILVVVIIAGVGVFLMRRGKPPVPEAKDLPPPPPEDGPEGG